MNKFCQNCGAQLEENAAFCAVCGAQQAQPVESVEPVQPVTQCTTYQTYSQTPVYNTYAPKRRTAKSKVLGGVGLGLSICGIIEEGIMSLYSWLFFMISLGEPGFAAGSIVLFIYAMVFSAFPIVGTILCKISGNDGNPPATARVGKILGIIGLILGGISIFFAFFSFFIALITY